MKSGKNIANRLYCSLFIYWILSGIAYFFTKYKLRGVLHIRTYSDIFGKWYEAEDCRFIPNMQQNYKYLNSGKCKDQLIDIVCGNDNKLVFVWKKSEVMDELYHLWCERKL